MRAMWIVWVAILMPFVSVAETGKVVSVIDGNTLVVEIAGESLQIMLAGIDCPELEQAYGEEARRLAEKLLHGKEVEVAVIGKDRKGNRLAEVKLVKNGVDPREELLRQGLAWVEEKNPHPPFADLEAKAREKLKGLWSEDTPTPPWVFRRQQTMSAPKSSSTP
jgi:micrococcal nuclease